MYLLLPMRKYLVFASATSIMYLVSMWAVLYLRSLFITT